MADTKQNQDFRRNEFVSRRELLATLDAQCVVKRVR